MTVRWAREFADDIDHVVVDRLVQGIPVPEATAYERREAVLRLYRQGCTQLFIGRQLRMNPRQVFRDLVHAGLVEAGTRGGKVMRKGYRSDRREQSAMP